MPSMVKVHGKASLQGVGKFNGLFVKLFKSLAPGRAAGGVFNLAASGGSARGNSLLNAFALHGPMDSRATLSQF